ncbi:MAG: DUF3018 family protein [Lachnospiraceae bacterium]|nr:DUF3018 family protein [Lachnospiraceae bacterium]
MQHRSLLRRSLFRPSQFLLPDMLQPQPFHQCRYQSACFR